MLIFFLKMPNSPKNIFQLFIASHQYPLFEDAILLENQKQLQNMKNLNKSVEFEPDCCICIQQSSHISGGRHFDWHSKYIIYRIFIERSTAWICGKQMGWRMRCILRLYSLNRCKMIFSNCRLPLHTPLSSSYDNWYWIYFEIKYLTIELKRKLHFVLNLKLDSK